MRNQTFVIKKDIERMAEKYRLQMIYTFDSRAKKVLNIVEGRQEHLAATPSDLDIGVKPENKLTVEEKALGIHDMIDALLTRKNRLIIDYWPRGTGN